MLLGSLPDSFIAHAVLKGCDQPLSPWLQGLLGLELSLRKERKLGSLKSHLIIQGVPSDPGRPSKIDQQKIFLKKGHFCKPHFTHKRTEKVR